MKLIAMLLVLLAMVAAMPSSGCLYRVNTGEAAVEISAGGDKFVETDVGWHVYMPIVGNAKKYKVVNNNMYFPSDYLQLQEKFDGDSQTGAIGMDIRATDDKVVDTSAKMTYSIDNLEQWGIYNSNSPQQMQDEMDSIIYSYLQSQPSDRIVGDVTNVSKEIFDQLKSSQIEERYGINIRDFALLRPTYTKIALDAMSEKQAMQAKSEGAVLAAQNDAIAIKTRTDAQVYQAEQMKNVPQEILEYNLQMAQIEAFKAHPGAIWIVPNGQPIVANN